MSACHSERSEESAFVIVTEAPFKVGRLRDEGSAPRISKVTKAEGTPRLKMRAGRRGQKKRQGGRSALPKVCLEVVRYRSVASEVDSDRSAQRAPRVGEAVEPAGLGENRGPVAGLERGVDLGDDLRRVQRIGDRARIEQPRYRHLIKLCLRFADGVPGRETEGLEHRHAAEV